MAKKIRQVKVRRVKHSVTAAAQEAKTDILSAISNALVQAQSTIQEQSTAASLPQASESIAKPEDKLAIVETVATASSSSELAAASVATAPSPEEAATAPTPEEVAAATDKLSESVQEVLAQHEEKLTEEEALAIVQRSKEQELNEYLRRNERYMAQARENSLLLLESYNQHCQERMLKWSEQETDFLNNLNAAGQAVYINQLAAFKKHLEQSTERGLKSFDDLMKNQETALKTQFSSRLQHINQQQETMLQGTFEILGQHQKQLEAQWRKVEEHYQTVFKQQQEALDKREDAFKQRQSALEAFSKELDWRKNFLDNQEEKLNLRIQNFFTKVEQTKEEFIQWRQSKLDSMQEFLDKVDQACANKFAEYEANLHKLMQDRQKTRETIQLQKAELEEKELELLESQEALDLERIVFQSSKQELERQVNERIQIIGGQKLMALKSRLHNKEHLLKLKEDQLKEALERNALFESYRHEFGDTSPQQVLLQLKNERDKNLELEKKLANLPSNSILKQFEKLKSEHAALLEQFEALTKKSQQNSKSVAQAYNLELDLQKAHTENEALEQQKRILEQSNANLLEELNRYRAQHGTEADRAKRIQAIVSEHQEEWQNADLYKNNDFYFEKDLTEIEWLDNIIQQCLKHDFVFPKRIIYAFHTSLKSAEWSPLTVLAGVSGTGKSELPSLYSKFGGINFRLLPVQPNWDCQEAMLGFFNSIDNVFEPQPVLRFLAQAQDTTQGKYGLSEQMNMILLDEMNLAHIELYFAEFLSKLEARRGKSGSALPKLDVKLGSGLQPFGLTLGRNVLWAGTMNQDETTKALSDKVIDRSNILYFPRPTSLYSRTNVRKSDAIEGTTKHLKASVWENQWVANRISFGEEINKYRSFLETINQSLDIVGRALGHRVWQSIESYMANYPSVKLAQLKKDPHRLEHSLRIAFEDQLVMKVMPKLRGIETRGSAREDCLDIIGHLLEDHGYYDLKEDFTRACEGSYGQFVWNNSTFLERQKDDVGLN